MKNLISLALAFGLIANGALAKNTAASTAARTSNINAIVATNTVATAVRNSLNNQTALGFATPSLAEADGALECSIDRVESDARDALKATSDSLANLAWEAEVTTSFGSNFEDAPITPNQLMMIRSVQSRTATKGAVLEWLSIHEAIVLCETGFKLLGRQVVEGRGGW